MKNFYCSIFDIRYSSFIVAISCWLLALPTSSLAQITSTTADTLTSSSSQSTTTFHPKKSPWLAVGFSAVAPGVGQIYNADYWKPPIIWGIGGYWVTVWVDLNKKYKDFGDQYSNSVRLDTNFHTGNGQFLRLRDFYRDERDKFAWYLGALYFLNLLDAYVSANLYDFDVSPDLGADGKITPRVTATIRLKF